MICRSVLSVVVSFLLLPLVASAASLPDLDTGIALLNNGKVEEAIVVLHSAAKRLPDPATASPVLGEAYLRLGMQFLNSGNESAARDAFAEAKGYLPRDHRPWQGMALAWLHEGEPAAAIGELQEALALAGDRADLLILLGRAWYVSGDLVQAEAALEQAMQAGAAGESVALLEKIRRERPVERAMSRDLGGKFSLSYAPGVSDALAGEVLDELQAAYQDLGADLGHYPEAEIPVLLYAREDFAAVTRSPEWAGALYDGKIRVPLGGVRGMSPALRAVLHHEYAHVLVRSLSRGRVPSWLNEGIAEVAGRRHYTPENVTNGAPPLSEAALDRPFGELPDELVPRAYQASFERVARLVALCGWPPMGELLTRLGQGEVWTAAIDSAYAPCGYDWPRLQVELTGELH